MLTAKVREKAMRKIRGMRLVVFVLVPAVALMLGAATPKGWAGGGDAIRLEEAQVFFEFNSTDLDLGFDIFLDGEPWTYVNVIGPDGRIFKLLTDGTLNELGQTETVTESGEPGFCEEYEDGDEDDCHEDLDFIEQKIDEFQENFPKGWYLFRGMTVEGEKLRGRAYLSHDLPAPPEIISPEEPEEAEGNEDIPLENPFIIEWAPGENGPKVVAYEVVAEMVIDGHTWKDTTTLPGWARRVTVAPQFIRLAASALEKGTLEEFKGEVVAIAANRNKTITEFLLFELPEDGE